MTRRFKRLSLPIDATPQGSNLGGNPFGGEHAAAQEGVLGDGHHRRPNVPLDPAGGAQVELLSEKGNQQVYKVDTRILTPPEQMPQLQNELHRALQRTESSLQNGRFEITNVEAIRDAQGAVITYQVTLRKK